MNKRTFGLRMAWLEVPLKQRLNPVWLLLCLALASGCGGMPVTQEVAFTPEATSPPTRTPPPTATLAADPTSSQDPDSVNTVAALPLDRDDLFSASGACALCHTRMQDEGETDVSIDTWWRATMKANAARDPYWQASVEAEVNENPQLGAEIEDRCATCHMPMARFSANVAGEPVKILGDDGFLQTNHASNALAMDGVSCSLCHQIRAEGLAGVGSYSGNFVIDSELRSPDRLIFGPYTIEGQQAAIMQGASGFRPEQGLHMTDSGFCATCHTLYTPYVDATGEIAGDFPEQVPYLEWFYSDYRQTRTCQDCHMPDAQGGVKIANTSAVLRSPFALHAFVGGNAYMLEILKAFGGELGVTATEEQFTDTISRTLAQLQDQTAQISLEEVRISGSRLYADIVLENLAGHKFPTGFPARRAWLHFTVVDAAGSVVFESGAYEPNGSIVGNDNDQDPARFEQHYLAIVQTDQVQIYEAVLEDTESQITTTLIEASAYRKDNRLLPSGFEKAARYEDIAVRGGAREDEDFQGGGDVIQYVIDLGSAQGPIKVTVELLYQSVGFRWVENLRLNNTPLVSQFISYYDAVPNIPVVVGLAEIEVER